MNNLVLIGMPACGKSTAGVLLAKTLGFEFIDSDLVIQKREGCLLSELIERKGIDGFIESERDANCSIRAEKSIISTGGSVVYCDETMQYLKKIGAVIYLRLSYKTIHKRLGDIPVSRGVVVRRGENLKDLYDERIPLYEKYADYTVDCEGQTVEETVQALYNLYITKIKGNIK
jgi:shikimate kinase